MTARASQPRYQVDRQNAVNPHAFIFARAEWEFEGDHPDSLVIHPHSVEPGSWSKPPEWFSRYAMSCVPTAIMAWRASKTKRATPLSSRKSSM